MPVIILAAVITLLVALYGGGVFFYNTAISTVSGKKPPGNPERKKNSGSAASGADDPANGHSDDDLPDQRYFDEHDTEDLYMQSRDGLMLHATAVMNDTSRWVVLCHGYTSRARHMSPFAELFDGLDFSVLAIDFRGHGESEGTYRGMGWHDSYDIWDWTDLLESRFNASDIILFGISMGASAVMMASGHALSDSVRGVIEDCGYSSVKAELKHNMKIRYHLPSFPLLNFASLVTKKRAGYSLLTDGDAAAQLKVTKLPVLFIHGEADTFVPFWMLKKVYKAASGPKMKFTVPGAGHGKCLTVDPEGYRDAVYSFLYKHVRI